MGTAEPGPAAEVEIGAQEPQAQRPELSAAAKRALAEAEERRAREATQRPPERHGRGGLDPVRYGDWEVKGIASDF
jgi:hypothetical protein